MSAINLNHWLLMNRRKIPCFSPYNSISNKNSLGTNTEKWEDADQGPIAAHNRLKFGQIKGRAYLPVNSLALELDTGQDSKTGISHDTLFRFSKEPRKITGFFCF